MTPLALLLALSACTPATPKGGADTGGDTAGGHDTGAAQTWDPRFDAVAAAAQADLAASDAASVSVAILEHGEVVFAAAFGQRHPDEGGRVTATTLYEIGSTTKQLTAAALLAHVHAGDITVDSSLADVEPDLRFALDEGWAAESTVHRLLSHQGGWYDYLDWSGPPDDTQLRAFHEGPFADGLFCMAPPGTFWNYANPNFTLAGLMNETLDDQGRYWPDIVRQDLFEPLGMDRTWSRLSEVQADGDFAIGTGIYLASGGTAAEGTVGVDRIEDPASARPAGSSTWSSPSQMVRWADGLMNGGGPVSDAVRAMMTTPHVDMGYPEGLGSDYGYGLFLADRLVLDDDTALPVTVWEHGGNTLSYTSALTMLPEHDFAISVLASGYGVDLSETVRVAVTTLVADLPAPVAQPPLVVDPEGLDRHVGSWNDPWNVGEATITREGDALFIELPLLEDYGYTVEPELYGLATDLWYVSIDGAWYDLAFLGGDAAASGWARNRAFVLQRVDEVLPAGPPPPRPDRLAVARALALGPARTDLALPPGPPR